MTGIAKALSKRAARAALATVQEVNAARPGLYWDAFGAPWFRTASREWLDSKGCARPARDDGPPEVDPDVLASMWLVQCARLRRSHPGLGRRLLARALARRWHAAYVRAGVAMVNAARGTGDDGVLGYTTSHRCEHSDFGGGACLGAAHSIGFYVVYADRTRSHRIEGRPPRGMTSSPLDATGLPERALRPLSSVSDPVDVHVFTVKAPNARSGIAVVPWKTVGTVVRQSSLHAGEVVVDWGDGQWVCMKTCDLFLSGMSIGEATRREVVPA